MRDTPTYKTVEEFDNHLRQQGYSDATKVWFWIGKAQQLEAELAEARRENGTTEFADRMNANIKGLGMELTEKQSRIAELKAQLAEARQGVTALRDVAKSIQVWGAIHGPFRDEDEKLWMDLDNAIKKAATGSGKSCATCKWCRKPDNACMHPDDPAVEDCLGKYGNAYMLWQAATGGKDGEG